MTLAADSAATVEARAAAEWALRNVLLIAERRSPLGGADAAHLGLVTADVTRFLSRPVWPTARSRGATMPSGTPIGDP